MKHLTIVSDSHITSPDINSLSVFPGYMKKHPKRYPETVETLQAYHDQSIAHLKEKRPHEVFLYLGDIVSGWQESGLAHPDQQAAAEEAIHTFKTMSNSFHVCWGDHDTGFTDQFDGLSLESLKACQTISPLWWSEKIESLVFIGITSTLARYEGDNPSILALQREQSGFVWDTLKQAGGAQWILCTHQRGVLKHLKQSVNEYKGTFAGLIHGHEHNPKISKFADIFWRIPRKFASKRIIACPSITPIFWNGAGYLSALVEGDKLSTGIRTFPVTTTKKSRFTSFIKCAYLCLDSLGRRK